MRFRALIVSRRLPKNSSLSIAEHFHHGLPSLQAMLEDGPEAPGVGAGRFLYASVMMGVKLPGATS